MSEDHSTPEASVGDPMDEIAELLLGGDDSGDDAVADPTQEQTPETPDTEDSDDAEELSEESTEGDEVDESDDSEDQTLAEMLGITDSQMSVTDDGDVMINVKVDGVQSKHSLSDVIKNYQTEGSVTNKSQTLANERREFDAAVASKAAEIKQTLERNQQLTDILQSEILSEYESVDWDDLRQYDPAEWSAKKAEFSAKYNKIQRLQQQLGDEATAATEETNKKTTAQQQEYLKGQWDTMLGNNPSWSDTDKYKKDMTTMREFASETYGFTDQDFSGVSDARLIEVIKDAQSYRKGSTVAKKKLIKAPRVQKRGDGGRYVKSKVSKLDKLTKAAKSATGSTKRSLQVDAVTELLTG